MMRWNVLRAVLLVTLMSGAFVMQSMGCGNPSSCKCEAGKVCAGNQCVDAEPSGEVATEPPQADSGPPTCPSRCSSDRDCVFCGDRKTCDLDIKECVDLRVQCTKLCNQDSDCAKPGCGARTTCNKDINECVERIQECPDSCVTNADCTAGGCGPRSECSKEFNACVDPTVANCPFVCKADDGCKECGANNKCSFSQPGATSGICRAFGAHECPGFCNSAADCYTQGCGERLYCNYALGTCVDKDKICPTACEADTDCATNCGTRTFCYKSSPDRSGYCATPPTAVECPATCQSSFTCKAKECGERAFCNYASGSCVVAADACPGNCTTDADCPKDKCGDTAQCRSGRCWAR